MADHPWDEPTREELEAAFVALSARPETGGKAGDDRAYRFAALALRGVLVGAGIAVLALYVAFAIGPARLSVERHLWAVATDEEREQIRAILFRSSAKRDRIYELTGERPPPPPDWALLSDLPPSPPPPPPPRPAHPFADTP